MKVVLISPPQNYLTDPLRAEPLGLMYIEGVFRSLGIDVELIDMSFETNIPKADIYGFSTSTVNFLQATEYAKQVSPAYTIIGGPHPSALPEEAQRYFNAVVIGPGESTISDILHDYAGERKGGIYRKELIDINEIPIPPRPILDKIHYNTFEGEEKSASIITSRGCPFRCSFCASNAIWGRKVKFRSIENVVIEIEYLKSKYDIHCFKFVDDIFTLNKERFKQFSDVLATLNIKWFCEARVDSIDDAILDQMVSTGCTSIDLGVESVDDIVLQKNQKNQTVAVIKQAIKKAQAKHLRVKLYLIYGLPFEPPDIVQKTIDFIQETNPDYASLFTLTPYPGTDIYNNPKKYNVKWMGLDFSKYQHSVGQKQGESEWLPCIEYFDRSREFMREERNRIKDFTLMWNKNKAQERSQHV